MDARFNHFSVLSLLVLLACPITSGCQPMSGNADNVKVSNDKVDKLAEIVDKLSESVSKLSDQVVTKKELKETVKEYVTREDLDEVKRDVRIAQAALAATKKTVAKADAKLQANIDASNQLRIDFNQVARLDHNRPGKHVVAIGDLVRKSSDFRDEFRNEVQRSVPQPPIAPPEPSRQSGILRVQNNAGTSEHVRVNGILRHIPALATVDFVVPTGTVTTELLSTRFGYITSSEPVKYWQLGPPDFFQQVDINPILPLPTPIYYSSLTW